MTKERVNPRPHRLTATHAAVWLAVFLFWLFVTRGFHPTLAIAMLATAVLVAAFALAVYANDLFLLPRLARRRLWLRYALSLLLVVVILDLAAVLLIQFIYDQLWGPDPLRYGFWFNMASDGAGIILHLALAAGILWFVRSRRGK